MHCAGAQRYERSAQRVDTRAGTSERGLHTKAGEVKLRAPKLRKLPFGTAIIERYKRRGSSVEDLRAERSVAKAADPRRVCLCLCGRDVAEAELGRCSEERERAHLRRSKRGRLPGSAGRGGRQQRRQGELGSVLYEG